MKKLITGIIALCIFNVGALSAHIITVSNNAVNVGQYTNLQTAVNAANAGDTVYVMGSPTDYGSVTISKPRITLMGAGYNVTGLQYNYSTVVDYVHLNGVVNSVKIFGLYVNSNIDQTGSSTIDSVDVERCYVGTYLYVYGSFWTIRNNDIDNVIINNHANVYIQNNFLQDIENTNQATVYVDHNVFATYGGNAMYTGISNAQITNNVFYYSNPENSTGCTFKNNICTASSAYNLNAYAGNTESGNIYAAPPGWTDATIPASTVSMNTIWNYKWTFTAASPAHLAATDGSDIGVYGGSYPMPNMNGFTRIPQMVSMSVTAIVPFGGNLNLNFKAQGIMAHGTVSGEYFFDTDPGLGNGTSIALTAGDSATIVNQIISISSLTATTHVIGVRVKDSVGHWSLYAAQNFYVQPIVASLPPIQIVSAEYFFDKDPGQGHGISLVTGAAADSVNVTPSVSIASLTPGYHSMFIRTENSNGQWSLYEGRNFYVQPTVVIPAPSKIVTSEYFFDKDPGQGHGTSIPTGAPADSVNVSPSISVSSLSSGYHSMFIRTQNTLGEWSLYEGRSFYVSPTTAIASASKIVAAEYFFDKDPGQGHGSSITVTKGDSVNVTQAISIASLTPGFHAFFIRTQDTAGRWSLYQGQNFFVSPTSVSTKPSKIVAAEYYFDFDPYNGVGVGNPIPGVVKADSVNVTQLLNASALSLGTHNILVRTKDSAGHWSLYEDRNFTVKACTITTTAKVINNASCYGSSNGSAAALPANGGPPYTYSWSTAVKQTKDTATGLSAGTYTVIVSDTTGCTAIDSIKISQPTKISVKTKTVVNTTCDSANGAAQVLATGGTGTITYAWNTSPVQIGVTAVSLSAGTYVVTATDANSCTNTDTVKIAPSTVPAISIAIAGNACGDSIGKAVASVSSGTPPYRYSWTNGDTINIANGLKAGVFIVTVTDKNKCVNSAPAIITDTNGPSVSAIITNVSCFGKSDGQLAITVIGGAAPYTYLWSNGATTKNISGLPAAPYQVIVTDNTGCQGVASFNVGTPFPLAFTTSSTKSACTFSTGTATVNMTGGTTPYLYSWNSGATSSTAPALAAGTYTVTIIDANGCSDSAFVAVSDNGGPTVTDSSISNAVCSTGTDGKAYLSVSGSGPYTYAWSDGETTSTLTAPAGNYNVTVTDVGGCIGSAVATIPDTPPVIAPICLVDVDTNDKNFVMWDKYTTSHIKSFNVYRETTSIGVYTLAATIPYDSLSAWEDPVARPDVRSYRYQLTQVDSCGNESAPSLAHKTMHLTANLGVGGVVNLIWDNYEGISPLVSGYIVYRDTIYDHFTRYDSVNSSIFTYTDLTPPASKHLYYRMGINDFAGCNPHIHAKTYNASHSNTANTYAFVGIAAINAEANSLNIYPNPTLGVFNVSLSLASANQNVKIKVFNAMGQLMLTENCGKSSGLINKQIDLSNCSKGVYFVQVISDANSMYRRVVIE